MEISIEISKITFQMVCAKNTLAKNALGFAER